VTGTPPRATGPLAVALDISATALPLSAALVGAASWNALRTVEVACGRFRRAAAGDALHLVVLLAGAGATVLLDRDAQDARTTVVAWTLAAATWAAAALLAAGRRRAAKPVGVRAYLDTLGRDMPWMALDGFLVGCTTATVVAVVGWTSGLAAAGAVRTSTTLFAGPVQMALVAVAPLLVARFRRDADLARSGSTPDRRSDSLRVLARVSGLAAAVATAVGALLAVVLPALTAPGAPLHDVHTTSAGAVLPLAVGLWLASTTTAYMRYRRPWRELMLVRLLTLATSLSVLVLSLVVLELPVAAGIVATAVPWLTFPLAHAVGRWRQVTTTLS
jgi:hypothetical protein